MNVSSDLSMSYSILSQQTMSSSSPVYEYSVRNSNSHHGSQLGQETANSEISCSEYQQSSSSPLEYTVEQTMSDVANKMTLSTRSLTRLQHRAMNENIIQW